MRLTSPGHRDIIVTWNAEGDLESGGGVRVCVRFSGGETGKDETKGGGGKTKGEYGERWTERGEEEEEEESDSCDISVKGKLTHEMKKEVTTTGEDEGECEGENCQHTHFSLVLTTHPSPPTNSLTPVHSPLVTFTSHGNK